MCFTASVALDLFWAEALADAFADGGGLAGAFTTGFANVSGAAGTLTSKIAGSESKLSLPCLLMAYTVAA